MSVKTAYITGGANGIGRAVAERLVDKGVKVAIADINLDRAKAVAAILNTQMDAEFVLPYQVDVSDWESQRQTFSKAVEDLGRVDFVFPIAGIGENKSWMPNDNDLTEFSKPDLTVIDVNLNGVLYTSSLAIQQMRKQNKDRLGFRGKSTSSMMPGTKPEPRRRVCRILADAE